MSVPLPNEIIQNGQTFYLNPYRGTYTSSRSYALRMQRGFSRGLSQTQARRAVNAPPGYSESQLRRERFRERYGFDVSEDQWRRMRQRYPDIDKINALSKNSIRPDMIVEAEQLQRQGLLPPDWIEVRLNNKLYAIRQYRAGNVYQGAAYFDDRIEYVPIEWWYYH